MYVAFINTGLMCLIIYRGNDSAWIERLLNIGCSVSFLEEGQQGG